MGRGIATWEAIIRIVGLDLSKTSTGYAMWGPGDPDVISGRFVLGSEFTTEGGVFCNLHEKLTWLNDQREIDAIFMEDTLNVGSLSGHTNITTLKILSGLNAHAKSWGVDMGCRIVREVHQATWRKEFLGRVPRQTRSATLKDMARQRCHQLGFKPYFDDEAEAIGILTYACLSVQITPFWLKDEVLRAELTGGKK